MSPRRDVLVECDNDETVVQLLLRRRVEHHAGKFKVCGRLREAQGPSTAMVDEDPGTTQPEYLTRLGKPQEFLRHELKLFKDRRRGHRIIVLIPRLEDWLLRTAQLANVDVTNLGLSLDPNVFKKRAMDDPQKLGRLLKDISTTERVRRLKGLLAEGPSSPSSIG